MVVLDSDIIQAFATDGFVVTPNLLDIDELDLYGRAVDEAVAKRTGGGPTTPLAERSVYEQSFVQCMRLWETDASVAPLTFNPKLAQAASELLGGVTVLLWQDQALYKEPGGRITDAHQDATFWPIGTAPLVTAWIPFEGSTVEGGGMGYVPGSHLVGPLKTVNLMKGPEAYDIAQDPALGGAKPVFVEAPPGSVVWHHGFSVHEAAANQTDRTRRTFTIVYLAAGHRRAKAWPNFPLDRAGVEVGGLMEGEGLPVAWPRDPDDRPMPSPLLGEPTGPQIRVNP